MDNTISTTIGKLSPKGPCKTLQKISDPYFNFHLTHILFLLMPTVVKIQPLNIFNNNIQRRPQDGDITPLPFISVFTLFFFNVYISLSLCMSYFLPQWYSQLLPLSLKLFCFLCHSALTSFLTEILHSEYFYDPYF